MYVVFMMPTRFYRYKHTPYTGTENQPDTLTFFIKNKDGNFLSRSANSSTTAIGRCVPIIGSFVGVARIIFAVKAIFNNLSNDNTSEPNDLWNSFKNLFRGIAEACPFSGIFLILFDSVRNSVSINGSIRKEIQDEHRIAGVAIDGKVCMTIQLDKLDTLNKSPATSDEHRLERFEYLSIQHLKKMDEIKTQIKIKDCFQILKKSIEERSNNFVSEIK